MRMTQNLEVYGWKEEQDLEPGGIEGKEDEDQNLEVQRWKEEKD